MLLALNACGGGGGGGGSNNGGSTPPPANPGGPPPPQGPTSVSVGGTVSGLAGSGLILQNNDGDELAIASDGAFVFRNSITGGSGTYNVTIKRRPANPMQTCIVKNGSGTAASVNINDVAVSCSVDYTSFVYQYDPVLQATGIYVDNEHTAQLRRIGTLPYKYPQTTVSHPTGKFIYLLPEDEDLIHSYSIDSASGVWTELGKPIQAGPGTLWGHIHPNGKFLYLANALTDQIARFAIADDGVLTPLTAVSLPKGSFPYFARMTSDGRFLFVANTGNTLGDHGVANIQAFAVDGATGSLASVPGGPYQTPVPPRGLMLTGNDNLLYVLPLDSTTTAAFRIDPKTGALTSVPAPQRNAGTADVVAHPGLPFAYLFSQMDGAIATRVEPHAIDETTGELSPIPGGAQDVGDELIDLEVDPAGRYLYVYTRNAVMAFAIDAATGRLTDRRVISSQRYHVEFVKTNTRPSLETKFVFASNDGPSNVSAFAVERSHGGLSRVNTSTPRRGASWHATLDSRARHLYTADTQDNTISAYEVGESGALAPISAGQVQSIPAPFQLAMHPTDKLLFASSESTPSIYVFMVNSSGRLALTNVVPTPYIATELLMHRDGGKLYVVNGALVSIYAVGSTGQLTRELDRDIGGARGIALHPNGRFFYAVDFDSLEISIYDSDLPVNVPPRIVQNGRAPYKIAIDPSGRFAYVLNASPSISAYFVDAGTGALVSMPGSPFLIEGLPSGLDFDVNGKMLYVSTTEPDSAIAFRVDGASGALARVGLPLPTPDLTLSLVAGRTNQ